MYACLYTSAQTDAFTPCMNTADVKHVAHQWAWRPIFISQRCACSRLASSILSPETRFASARMYAMNCRQMPGHFAWRRMSEYLHRSHHVLAIRLQAVWNLSGPRNKGRMWMYKFFHRWKVQRKKEMFASRVSVTTPKATVPSGSVTRTVSPRLTGLRDKAFLIAFFAFLASFFDVKVQRVISKIS